MKSLSFSVLSLLICYTISAQNQFPPPQENPYWNELHGLLWSCTTVVSGDLCSGYWCECNTQVYYKTDTVISGTLYNRLFSFGNCQAYYTHPPPPGNCPYYFEYPLPEYMFAIIRRDTINNKVYIWESNSEYVLYDFANMIVGSFYPTTYQPFYQPDSLIIVSEDSVFFNNEYYKKWDLGVWSNGIVYDSGFVSIIEGIGSTFGIKAPLRRPFENKDELICFAKNDTVIYPNSTYNCNYSVELPEIKQNKIIEIFPNPANDYIIVKTIYKPAERMIMNIKSTSGQLMLNQEIKDNLTQVNISTLSKGVYVLHIISNRFCSMSKIIKE